ncbi:16S rRNA (uracil(1498)-N(3))-methyltransferase [Oceanithermus desulfurans]|uniref:Ribosomal RNA small subunit methyltransferase E n=2 Tax=Oceanithermus desulfurans TaxID=227924 RepID=A0A511RGK0_9DEIN|nr:16S rRNA (uracil(1498)-N(3))-methyltransferase [Oceanithermus desulfurans]MBB6030223.1 16S rRNA (uracil1498-N3)-methyltransferase [Oceanithermus desulfurans]GEM88781.1 ribosomal RNA small subunit methyltransferase E [Oceanithermus desulfurans NBRC 100063]
MRKPRVFVPRIDPEIVLTGREAHHLLHVLRVRPGREVVVFDGAGLEAEARVLRAGEGVVRLEAGEPRAVRREPPLTPVLYLALLKGNKLADVVRAGSELGVGRFVLLVTERGVPREMGRAKLERLRRIAVEAAKQSGRSRLPEVAPPVPLAALKPVSFGLVAHPGAAHALAEVEWPGSGEAALASGPEGGFTEAEVAQLIGLGFRPVGLGPRILRAETAPLVLAAATAAARGM